MKMKKGALRGALVQGAGLLFFGGLILAGSDGTYFPWPNLAGVAMSAIAAVTAVAGERRGR